MEEGGGGGGCVQRDRSACELNASWPEARARTPAGQSGPGGRGGGGVSLHCLNTLVLSTHTMWTHIYTYIVHILKHAGRN